MSRLFLDFRINILLEQIVKEINTIKYRQLYNINRI